MARKEFKTKDRHAIAVFDYEFKNTGKCVLVVVFSRKTGRELGSYKVKSIDGVNSFAALMRACKDPSNQFCPHSVSCDTPFKKTDSQDGGNPPPPPASSNPTTGGNLLSFDFGNGRSLTFSKNVGFVLAVFSMGSDKYKYPMSFESYYKIKQIDQECFSRHGYRLGIKRLLQLCKKYSYDKDNQYVNVA